MIHYRPSIPVVVCVNILKLIIVVRTSARMPRTADIHTAGAVSAILTVARLSVTPSQSFAPVQNLSLETAESTDEH